MADTIFALSSGSLPAGVAVIRISGPQARFAIETIAGKPGKPRQAILRTLMDPANNEAIDRGLALWFPSPESFTGDDCAEIHMHGGPAVVRAMLAGLAKMPLLRMAEPGEFTRRAFENGKFDLTEIEGLADLINAETDAQRRQAFLQAEGGLRQRAELWREELIRLRAAVEAILDFADEDDVPEELSAGWWDQLDAVRDEIAAALEKDGEIVRRGYQVVLMGRPNAGKSSLLNALAGRDVAIVTEEAGTTRDLLEVRLDLGGYPVTVVDTAGIREAEGMVEREGVRRAMARSSQADLVVWLTPAGEDPVTPDPSVVAPVTVMRSKDDEGHFGEEGVSVIRQGGLDALVSKLRSVAAEAIGKAEDGVVTRERHRGHLRDALENLDRARKRDITDLAIRAEYLRAAGDAIGRLTGSIDVEDLLDVIFSEFCIGK